MADKSKKVIVGFTGTRVGMTSDQRRALRQILKKLKVTELHHGDCVGTDAQAHRICLSLKIAVHLHPPDKDDHRAFSDGPDKIYRKKPYLDRNRDIALSGEYLIATPKGFEEELRSGTWMTIRYAAKCAKQIIIIWPNGKAVLNPSDVLSTMA